MQIVRTRFSQCRRKKTERKNFKFVCHADKQTPGQCDNAKLNLCVNYNSITEYCFLSMASYNFLFVAMDFCNGYFTLFAHKLVAFISSLSTNLMSVIKTNKIQMKNSIRITKHLITVIFSQLLTHAHFVNLTIYCVNGIQGRRLKYRKNLKKSEDISRSFTSISVYDCAKDPSSPIKITKTSEWYLNRFSL